MMATVVVLRKMIVMVHGRFFSLVEGRDTD
jgi:hypothetical protein